MLIKYLCHIFRHLPKAIFCYLSHMRQCDTGDPFSKQVRFTLGSNLGIRNSERKKKKEKEKIVMLSLQHNRPL